MNGTKYTHLPTIKNRSLNLHETGNLILAPSYDYYSRNSKSPSTIHFFLITQYRFCLPVDILLEVQFFFNDSSHVRAFEPSAVDPEPLVRMFSDHGCHPGLHDVAQFLDGFIPFSELCRIDCFAEVPVVGAIELQGMSRHDQGIALESNEGWSGFGGGQHAEDIAEQVVFVFPPHVDDYAHKLALFQGIDKHVEHTLGRQESDTVVAGSDIVHDCFKFRVIADISHNAELGAQHPGDIEEDFPVADVAGENHDSPAGSQGLVQVLFSLHHDPGLYLLIAHIYIPDRVHQVHCLVHEYLQHEAPRVCYTEGSAYLDRGHLPVEHIHEEEHDAEKPEEIHHEWIGQESDKPDQDKDRMIFQLLHKVRE